ncbi:microneme protein 13, partial [Cystoisospora suis]
MLDTGCQSEFDRICKTGDKAFCGKTVVARKDKGRSAQATAEWRCYAFEELDFEEVTSVCVDNCGEEMRCQGGIKGKESVDHVTWRKLTELLKTGKA